MHAGFLNREAVGSIPTGEAMIYDTDARWKYIVTKTIQPSGSNPRVPCWKCMGEYPVQGIFINHSL